MFMHRGEGVGRGRKGRGPIKRLTESYMDGSFAKIFEVYLEKFKTNEQRTSNLTFKMLSNAYYLAKFRFDTAENEPTKNLQNFKFC